MSEHLKRNQHNIGVVKQLKRITKGQPLFRDETGRVWKEQPLSKNRFHMPSAEYEKAQKGGTPWSRKFLAPDTKNGGEFEMIIRHDGKRVTKGKYRETYNFGRTEDYFGIKHLFQDILPHFVSDNYVDTSDKGWVKIID